MGVELKLSFLGLLILEYFEADVLESILFPTVVCCDGCRLADLVGMGVATAVGAQFVNAFPERVYVSRLFPLLMEAQRFGE